MPYNTRRKSLSLPSLGIALPGRPLARSPPATTIDSQHQQPPQKKVKRTHSITSNTSNTSAADSQSNKSTSLRIDEHRPKSSGRVADTPPPSPGGESGQRKIDTQGIDDTIVVGVIEQLEKTGNRPHLLKELAAILSTTIPIVESSANPAAIISSRLATYLKRSWTALSRCPLDKKLVGTHPKRVYYFLTTSPHQPIPTNPSSAPSTARIISPSLSSATSEEAEDAEARSRDRMSPSPELEFSSYEEDEESDSNPFSNQSHPPTSVNIAHNRRAQSPPLEKDEREFTQTASFLQQRRKSQEAESQRVSSSSAAGTQSTDVIMDDASQAMDETEESAARKNSETAAALFGSMSHLSNFHASDLSPGSPLIKPVQSIETPHTALKRTASRMEYPDLDWNWDPKGPEHIELDELEDLFDDY
ncbi:hypothetical protein BU24DRAFT_22462 [Aaosphaeria arxii CBS 175.79]|uniref:GDS1 winged helix domain-containing protein n=1 Tax=Aaosphaeria arxii CBS 175.79 TaxID=1450172 RepID=A0A6A5Y7R0_9PLEO|nr:uncharacterized protein BU24DRAFT_22462 [Aaosphaeria arxii CBS 175.79]KAF2021548.1 hypothetical protein BU24DRAFT_22462 [Aaosphaeria arxii CBS 175.79]